MGPRSLTNMVFIVLLAGTLVFGVFVTWNMFQAVIGPEVTTSGSGSAAACFTTENVAAKICPFTP